MPIERKAILCLCEDATLLELRRLLLERFGYTVWPAHSAEAAATIAKNDCPDMFLMDHSFRGAHFKEVAEKVRTACPEVITVVLSPYFATRRTPETAVDRFISRDEAPDHLIANIRELLGSHGDEPSGSQEM